MELPLLLWLSFLAGILAPVSSPCVLVLYPGYISFLAGHNSPASPQLRPVLAGVTISCGILLSLLVGGIVFSWLLQVAGGPARAAVTTGIYLALLFFSLLLILGTWSGHPVSLPQALRPADPRAAAFLYGALFGTIILPCNAAAVIVLLALAATAQGFWEGMGAFLFYGVGLIAPLLALAVLTRAQTCAFLQIITRHKRGIRIWSGIFMLAIALWYLGLALVPAVQG